EALARAPAALPPLGQTAVSFAELARQAAPGVVNVHTSRTVAAGPFGLPLPEAFREFFGEQGGRREYQVPSLGTGFVVSADGYIVTNAHVVEGVDSITVTFEDGSEAEAQVVGQDPKTDVALIRVEGRTDLRTLPLGDSDQVQPGDWVIAIGNPFGLEHTVTAGIVSAKGREIGQGPYDDFIQTDAAINPGNSGGPLLNLAGEVIGINAAINPRANTIGFAVPINLAKEIIPQLKASGRVTRGWLGVGVQRITPELAEAFQLPSRKGALISQVAPGGPAAEGGIERGDVIVAYRGEPVEELRDLPRAVSATRVGQSVEVTVLRDGERVVLRVTIGKLEEPETVARAGGGRSGSEAFGLSVTDLTAEQRRRLGAGESEKVVVTQVDPNASAAQAGLRPGDVLLELNREPIASAADLAAKLDAAGKGALLLVRRGESTIFVPLKPPAG
ncbi:MAG: Do family serine endopeptidase, partial [Myxococcota bacterium]